MRITLIDDEPESLILLTALITPTFPDVIIEGTYTDPFEGLQALQDNKPDLLLLDIEMPGLTGLELLKRLPRVDFEVIFITAYNQYAINAIKLCALDYLLKPVNPEELFLSIRKAKEHISKKESVKQFQLLVDLLKVNNNPHQNQRIALPTQKSVEFVKMNNVARIEADKNYCTFHLIEDPPIVVSKNIGIYEDSLEPFNFMRVHRSHIINLQCVKRYLNSDSVVEMNDGVQVAVSNTKKDQLIGRLKSF